MKNNWKVILIYLVLIFVVFSVIFSLLSGVNTGDKPVYSDVVQYFTSESVESFVISDDNVISMQVKTEDGSLKTVNYQIRDIGIFYQDLGELILEQKKAGILTEYEYEPYQTMPWWIQLLPYVIILFVIIGLFYFVNSQMAGGKGGSKINSFGKSRAKLATDDKNKVTFKDVAGADEEKEELEEIVDFLKSPEKYTKLGAKIPHGVLLMGPPGTGKTLLAKAVAGEAGVPFFSISGSDFVEMYVGVGASRVRDLFENARKYPASIVFIDEIDAVGRHRGAGLGGGHDEREQTLNQLLVEMDGFGSHDGIIVMAATNRPDILDPALLRPGRFDRQITVGYPNKKGRKEILEVHARNKKFEGNVDFDTVAKSTAGFTGADLANLLNEAALLSARRNKTLIGMKEIEESFLKIITGPKKRSINLSDKAKKNTAYHEAGHAIVSYVLPTCDPVHMISIIPSGRALGYTINLPQGDKVSEYRQELVEEISVLLAGRAAERLVYGDYTGGASNDIERATAIAKKMITKYGMSDKLGPVKYGSGHDDNVFLGRDFSANRDYSENVSAKIDEEIHSIITSCMDKAVEILTENREKLDFIADYLFTHSEMDADQFKLVMEGTPTVEEVEAVSTNKEEQSKIDNEAEKEKQEQLKKEREESAQKRLDDLNGDYNSFPGSDNGNNIPH